MDEMWDYVTDVVEVANEIMESAMNSVFFISKQRHEVGHPGGARWDKGRERILPFGLVVRKRPLIARGGLMLFDKMAETLNII